MSWKHSWILPPLSVIEGYSNEGKSEKDRYSNFLKDLSPDELKIYTELLPTHTNDSYGLMLFNELKPKMGGRRKKLRKTRAKNLKRKTRRNK
jgi:hypothetical protein